jgi:ectoine hydroxylase-related dioxygenase (phytanoyl-CoA dioxygenase family)
VELYAALKTIYPASLDFVSWQDMAFDRSTGTIDHLDSWYLDTEMPGGLVGAWLALEDIHMESGPFFVCPGSHHLGAITKREAPDHESFLACVQKRIKDNCLDKVPMLLKKGDLLLWSSLLIHGAFSPSAAPCFSRKSLTAHFYPLGLRRNDALGDRQFRSDLKCLRQTRHPRIHRLVKFGRTPSFYAFGGPFLALKERLSSISSNAWNMRR